MKYMRITAKSAQGMCVQTSEHREHGYKQVWMSEREFIIFMQTNFPACWEEFLKSESLYPMDFFYNFGETPEMIRKGESFVYETEVHA